MVGHSFTCLFICHNGKSLAMILLPQQLLHTAMTITHLNTQTQKFYNYRKHLCFFSNAYVEISELTKKYQCLFETSITGRPLNIGMCVCMQIMTWTDNCIKNGMIVICMVIFGTSQVPFFISLKCTCAFKNCNFNKSFPVSLPTFLALKNCNNSLGK